MSTAVGLCSQSWTEQPCIVIDDMYNRMVGKTDAVAVRSERATGMAETLLTGALQTVSECVGLYRPPAPFPPLPLRNLFFCNLFLLGLLPRFFFSSSHDVPLTPRIARPRHLLSFTKRSMVSPTRTTAHPPVLSYAESAKKAQGVRHPSQPTQRPLSNPPRQPPAPPPELKKPAKPSSSVDVAQISLADLSLSDTSAPGAPGANVQSHTSTGESTTYDSSTRERRRRRPCRMYGIRGFNRELKRDHNLVLLSLIRKRHHRMCCVPQLPLGTRLSHHQAHGNQIP
ncbi:hypothetical protein F5888DRAFT_956150 [Russula emetica]|nr:hypothetical protein F5888DRAFT_956150 [Russula emetica]